jgi:hypothetical protein
MITKLSLRHLPFFLLIVFISGFICCNNKDGKHTPPQKVKVNEKPHELWDSTRCYSLKEIDSIRALEQDEYDMQQSDGDYEQNFR